CFNVFQPGSTVAGSPSVVQISAQADLSSIAPFLDTNSFLDTVLDTAPGFNDAATSACVGVCGDAPGETLSAPANFPANTLEALNVDVPFLDAAPQPDSPLQELLSAVFPGFTSNPGVARVRVTPPA